MASSGYVEVAPETDVVVEKPAAETCGDGAGSCLAAATTTTVESGSSAVHDTAPAEPDHHDDEAAAPEQHAAEVSASEEEVANDKAKEEGQQKQAPAAGGDPVESTRERLKRHRLEMAGRVWVPDMWGQEKLLKDWVGSAVFDRPLVPAGLLTARRALVAECCTRRPDRATAAASASSSPLRVHNGCS